MSGAAVELPMLGTNHPDRWPGRALPSSAVLIGLCNYPPARSGRRRLVETKVIAHGQTFCPIGKQRIPKDARLTGADCPFCPVELPPKNRRLLVAVDEDDNVITSKLSSHPTLWRHPLFIIFVVFLAAMIVVAIAGRF